MHTSRPVGTDVIAAHGHGLAAVGRAHRSDTPVPTCGDWTLADLVWHLAEVQDFWCHIIGRRPEGPDSYDQPERPAPDELPDLLDSTCTRLVDLLADIDPTEPAWSWSADHTTGFTVRRQSHEAFIHHVDGLLAVGAPPPAVTPALAADGIDELVTVMLTGVPDWAGYEPGDDIVRLVATDADAAWTLRFGRMTGTSPETGKTHDLVAFDQLHDPAEPTTTVSSTAQHLDLWMWGRSTELPTVSGDTGLVERFRAAVAECTA